jgi:hypothetical protein
VFKKFMASASGGIDVTPNIAPLTFMIASCPLLLGLIEDRKKGTAKNLTMAFFVDALNSKLGAIGITAALSNDVTCAEDAWKILGATTVSKSGSSAPGKPDSKPAIDE